MQNPIGDSVRWHGIYSSEKLAIISPQGSITYAEFWSRAIRVADGLSSIGVAPGDRVALMMANGAPYIELYVAAALLGAAVVPVNFRFVAKEVEYLINHSGAKALVYDSIAAPTVREARSRFTSEGLRYVALDGDRLETADKLTSHYEQLIADSRVLDWAMDVADPEACYFQGYTAGTTGFPKGCVNPHREFADCLRRMGLVYGITDTDIELVAAPLFHEAPALFALTQIMRGGCLVIPKDSSPETLMTAIQNHKVTWTFMVPTMWTSFVTCEAMSRYDLSSLRIGISGGSALQTSTKQAILEKMSATGLNEFYGGTEVGLVTNLSPEDQSRKVRSVGRPVPDMYVELRSEEGQPVKTGEIGEIHVGGATLIREYYKNPEATQSARSSGGFFSLGDMGRFDDEGYLYIVDRKKDMIISGGENIYPNDIEDALYQYPGVQMVAVVGAPDNLWGEIVVAVVVSEPGVKLDEQLLIAHCKENLSPFKVPKRIDFRAELPLSAFGKILRREVKDTYWEGHTARV